MMKLRKRGEGWDLDSGRGGTSGGNKDKKADVDGCDWLTDPADYSLTSKPPRLTFSNPMQASGNFQCRNAEISTRE
ncbi:hypothetical protein V6N12_071322 [Hibiscus sabdariffa]|uniref:Uncharacterized protein n=1 Tax=Hibiscus sabdariffa TaxID=183260 RepID=A0ABR2FK35_9ROSI